MLERCRDNRQLILDKFPKLNRFLTGYDLRHVFNDELTQFDLTRVLTGSEGTLYYRGAAGYHPAAQSAPR